MDKAVRTNMVATYENNSLDILLKSTDRCPFSIAQCIAQCTDCAYLVADCVGLE